MSSIHGWSRRQFLEIAGLASGAVILRSGLLPRIAEASTDNPQLLLFVYFSGGWDQMLCWDPRDISDPRFQAQSAYSSSGTGIYPAYDLVTDTVVRALLAQQTPNPTGLQQAGNLTFGPAVTPSLMEHYSDLCIIRGLSMETLTHEVGRRYFITGKFPRGLTANGSALTSVVANQEGISRDLPNLAISSESYSDGLPAYASPIHVNSASDVLDVLRPLGLQLASASDAAVRDFETSSDTCEQHTYNGGGLITMFRDSRAKARTMTNSTAAQYFNFTLNPSQQSQDVRNLFTAMQIATTADLNGPKGKGAIAAQALCKGLSQAVSVQIAQNMDDHFNWDTNHATTLRNGFEALGLLIRYLKGQPFRDTAASVWDHTTLLCFSEFARTPLVNSRNGRDHHLTSSCLVAGPGIRGNSVLGASSDLNLAYRKMNLTTGLPDDNNGTLIHPSDVHASVLKSMGLTYDHLSNQSPQIITALLK